MICMDKMLSDGYFDMSIYIYGRIKKDEMYAKLVAHKSKYAVLYRGAYVAPCIYVITVASARTESPQQHRIFAPQGTEPMTKMEYSMNLAYIVSYIFSSRLIPYWGQTFFKKLFFRKTDCCNIAVSSTSRRTVVALGKELWRL